MSWGEQLTNFVVVSRAQLDVLLPRMLDIGACFGLERLPTREEAFLLHLTSAGLQALGPDLSRSSRKN